MVRAAKPSALSAARLFAAFGDAAYIVRVRTEGKAPSAQLEVAGEHARVGQKGRADAPRRGIDFQYLPLLDDGFQDVVEEGGKSSYRSIFFSYGAFRPT